LVVWIWKHVIIMNAVWDDGTCEYPGEYCDCDGAPIEGYCDCNGGMFDECGVCWCYL
jgi:hypothetical protein